ncbi:MAG: FAD:protein FMN transferase [Thermonema sp.]|uniref:FAD:protein FMN transferase n=1 Tax=Thermonema sp. TaxID=2231181 RepID=UPI0021DEA8E1|nr:FAD:protein FMN transferase [Thermonema sp.]GIV39957.1 MAG: FAD:protein FMN transferase [Thermonema sp.]
MNPRAKNIIYSLLLLVSIVGVYHYRAHRKQQEQQAQQQQLGSGWFELRGSAQGTTYQIKYYDSLRRDFQPAIDSLLRLFDQALSTYLPTSEISRFNAGDTKRLCYRLPYFLPVLQKSKEVYEATGGAFDPTVAPLVRAYGFAPAAPPEPPKGAVLDSLRRLVGFSNIDFNDSCVWKKRDFVQLDFNAIAQGYSVDVLADYLLAQGVHHFMIELGGELRCAGKNKEGNHWRIGIKDPLQAEKGKSVAYAIVELENEGLATSGNYEKFYVKNGKKYTHTIDPRTGYPVTHSLLSATVIAPDAMTADAYATAFMVVGLDEARRLLDKHPELKAYLIYDDRGKLNAFVSPALKQRIVEIKQESN